MIDRLYARFESFAKQNQLFSSCRTILAAISGGADSMVMLDLLRRYSVDKGIELYGLHVHHGLRGEFADADQKLVEESCRRVDIDCFTTCVDVREYSKKNQMSLEMAGRELRYVFFEAMAKKYANSVIATAHTLNDHVETIFLHFIKGCGINGLTGIPIQRPSIVRPIRFLTKQEIYQYAQALSISYHEDHTNRHDCHERNLVRNQIFPLIEKMNPSFADAVHKISLAAGEIKNLVDGIATEAFPRVLTWQKENVIGLDIEQLTKYPDVIKKAILHLCLDKRIPGLGPLNFSEQQQYIALLANRKTGASLILRNRIELNIDRANLVIREAEQPSWKAIKVCGEGIYENDHFRLTIKKEQKSDPIDFPVNRNSELIDAEKFAGECILRPWKHGDKMQILGSKHHKKLSDILIDQKIPNYQKNLIPILVCNGEITWICGLRLSESFKISKETKTIYRLHYEEKDV